MPRRDQLSEKKKEQLMLEREQLQKLMLLARSSVRRSSLRQPQEENAAQPEEASAETIHLEETIEAQASTPDTGNAVKHLGQKEPLTEKDLFPVQEFLEERVAEKRPLTERELFPDTGTVTEPRQPEKFNSIKVILPKENTAATTVSRIERSREDVMPHETETFRAKPLAIEQAYVPAEAHPPVYETKVTAPGRTRSKVGRYAGLLLVALLAGFAGYYFYTSNQKGEGAVGKERREPVPKPVSQTPVQPDPGAIENTSEQHADNNKAAATTSPDETVPISNETPVAKSPVSNPAEEEAKTSASQKPISEELKNFDNITIVQPSKTVKPQAGAADEPTATSGTRLGKYKVISKAYFHNEPDAGTRRKAFIIHWNNAVLTPQEERNGFVYIVFTNHLGQTSKGWLRKRDLRPVD